MNISCSSYPLCCTAEWAFAPVSLSIRSGTGQGCYHKCCEFWHTHTSISHCVIAKENEIAKWLKRTVKAMLEADKQLLTRSRCFFFLHNLKYNISGAACRSVLFPPAWTCMLEPNVMLMISRDLALLLLRNKSFTGCGRRTEQRDPGAGEVLFATPPPPHTLTYTSFLKGCHFPSWEYDSAFAGLCKGNCPVLPAHRFIYRLKD